MKASCLSDQDRKECDEAFHAVQARASELPALTIRAEIFAAVALVSIGGEYCLTYSVVYDAIGPLPGEPPSIVPAIVALSGLISVIAFTLYKRVHPGSLPVRIVGRVAGYVALGFVIVMGMMLAKLIFANTGGGDVPVDLFGAEEPPSGASLLARFFDWMSGPFALVFGLLTICNLYVAEYALTKLREVLQELHELRARVTQSRSAMNEVEECECELSRLEGERQQASRGLEPKAAYAYASELASVIADARSPIEQWIAAHRLRRKPPESVFGPESQTDIDIDRLEERVSALTLDAKVIYAAFRGEDKAK